MDINQLKAKFLDLFGGSTAEIQTYFAPGRINLIGEHTDYNNGLVFPCALDFGTYMLLRKNDLNMLRFESENFDYGKEIPVGEISNQLPGKWMNYPLGVFHQLLNHGFKPQGMDLLYAGDIPNSAGLSSSASIEVVTAFGLNDMFDLNLDTVELVKISQKAENEFVGVNCGIMDQFAVGMGKSGHALFLDCGTLDYELVPLNLGGYKIVIANTNKPRGLADSKYNERVSECKKAVEFLSQVKNISGLSDLSYQEFIDLKHHIPDITIRKRAKHILSENQRVLDAVTFLKKNNLRVFGKLMNASHNSLRYDYEVTGFELDVMVEEARKQAGVLGARMTGAGFGGCAIALVEDSKVAGFISEVGDSYRRKTSLEPEFYLSDAGDGVKRIL
jgi:galactokinase